MLCNVGMYDLELSFLFVMSDFIFQTLCKRRYKLYDTQDRCNEIVNLC